MCELLVQISFVFLPTPGVIHEERLRELLTTMGDRFTEDEVDLEI